MNRFDHLHKIYREQRVKARKERILQSSRTVVDANAHGTSGYVIKHGENKGSIDGHTSVIHQNKTF